MVFHILADSALEEGLPKDKTKESKITPIISSKIAADTIHVSYYLLGKGKLMRYGFYYLLFFAGAPLVLWLLLRKRPIWARRWFRAGAVALIIVLGAALALIPRKSVQTYSSPEEAFRYKNQGEVLLVLEGEQSAYVIAQQSSSSR